LLKAEEEWEQLLAQFTLWMVPLVNPDGVRLALDGLDADHPARQQLLDWNQGSENFSQWKANGNGVDLNDQFPAGWERERKRRQTDHPGPRDYGGAAPLSEPEARALARHARLMPFAAVLAFHTQGAEIYWNYADFEPSETERMAEQMGECAGLCAVKLADSDAGFKDWFIQEFRRPGFTVELGRGTNPLPYQDLPVVERQMELTVLACLRHLACATAQVNEP
jgi:g-D-glutamyl-meso-diaminopimelate peptidase